MRRGISWSCVWFFAISGIAQPLQAQTNPASDAERLERLERAVQLLQERNAELERQVSDLKSSKKSSAPASSSTAPAKEDEGKAVAEKKEKKEEKKTVFAVAGASEFKLTLGGFVQTQFEAGDVFAFEGRFQGSSGEIKDRFRIRRARITLTGDYAEDFDFKVEGEFSFSDTALTIRDANGRTLGSNSTRTAFSATDVFANWHRFPEFNLKAGQYKAPFGMEQLSSDTKLLTPERSLVTTALTPDRQIGLMLWGKPLTNLWPEQKDLITYYAGVFNGTGRNITTNDNNEFMYVGRVEVLAMKTKILNQDATLKFGADGLHSRDESGNTISPVLRESGDGSLASYSLTSAGQREAYGVDAALHIGPFDLSTEYLNEKVSSRALVGETPFTNFHPDGYYVLAGYYLVPKKLQLVTKYESFSPDQFNDDDIHSITAGLNYYIKGDEIKLLANYIHTWSDFREGRPAFADSEFDEVIVRLQLMF